MLLKYDTNGNHLWNTTHPSATGYALHLDSQNNIFAGSSKTGQGIIAIYDTNGNSLNNYSIGTISSFEGYGFDTPGNLFAGGYVNNGNYDYHLIKFNSTLIPSIPQLNLPQVSGLPSINIFTTILLLIGFFIFG